MIPLKPHSLMIASFGVGNVWIHYSIGHRRFGVTDALALISELESVQKDKFQP